MLAHWVFYTQLFKIQLQALRTCENKFLLPHCFNDMLTVKVHILTRKLKILLPFFVHYLFLKPNARMCNIMQYIMNDGTRTQIRHVLKFDKRT